MVRRMSDTGILLTTTLTFEGRLIKRYVGIVTSEVTAPVRSTGGLRKMFAFADNYVAATQETLAKGRAEALNQLRERAREIGANGLVDVALEHVLHQGTYFLIAATGTAVIVE
jgi:uncharacterized protein YbjQ (UPF0145 family)